MKNSFYPKLAITSIRNNRQYYIPYVIAGILMVTMFSILNYLNASDLVASLEGGSALKTVFFLGIWVIAFFSLLYLFYANSFLIKVRNRELGLYSILGMNRKNLMALITVENMMIVTAVIPAGLFFGIALSKAAELLLAHIIEAQIPLGFTVMPEVLINTLLVYLIIYGILYLCSLFRVWKVKPLALMKESSYGEKKPKANFIPAIIGVILLAAAYYIAITIENAVSAINLFFIAVILVIIATYLLLISGSVALCTLLEKNRNYYYHPNHFISVSTMRFRMKHNGAGLASICVLVTMVLVMITMSCSLYIGLEDSLHKAFPLDVQTNMEFRNESPSPNLKTAVQEYLDENVPDQINPHMYEYAEIEWGSFTENGYVYTETPNMMEYNTISFVDEDTYSALFNEKISLSDDECIVVTDDNSASYDTYSLNEKTWTAVSTVHGTIVSSGVTISPHATITVVIHSLDDFYGTFGDDTYEYNGSSNPYVMHGLRFACDVKDENAVTAVTEDLFQICREENGDLYSISFNVRTQTRFAYLQLFGGFLVLCVMLSIMFLVATVIIIYYKQISEGFEDRKRFEILKKVGMSEKEIRTSINSQVLTMFLFPLLLAGMHLLAAEPMVCKILLLCGMHNTSLILMVTAGSFAVFAIVYALIYRLTSKTYFHIINS